MPGVHRHTDSRICGASTKVTGQSDVFVNNLLASVDRDPNTHSAGNLKAQNPNVYINNKLVVIKGNPASPDGLCPGAGHCCPTATGASPNVFIGG